MTIMTAGGFVVASMPPALPPRVPPRLVLLDRDGVINEDVGAPGVVDVADLRLIPGAAAALGRLRRTPCAARVALVTNQSCVGKGLLSPRGLDRIHDAMRRLLRDADADAGVDAIYACLSRREDGDPRMKPGPGMVSEALRDFGVGGAEAVFVGDTLTDMQAAKTGGVELRVLVETGYGRGLMGDQSAPQHPVLVTRVDSPHADDGTPFVYARNLEAAAAWLHANVATSTDFTC